MFAGDAAVGKTSFINRLTKGHFVSNVASTLGVDFQVKTIRVDERNVAIQGSESALLGAPSKYVSLRLFCFCILL